MRHERALTGRINVFGRVEVVDEHGQVLTVSSWSVETPDFDAILRAAHWHGLPPEVRRRAESFTA